MVDTTEPVPADGLPAVAGLSFILVDPAAVTQPVLRPVLDYWEQKRAGRAMPRRQDIEPAELKAYLPHISLVEPLPGGDFRYRLVGSAITERYGRNSTGKTFREIYPDRPDIALWLTRVMEAVVAHRRPVLATGSLGAVGKEHVLSEALLLPLSDDAGNVTTIFGATRYSMRGAAAERPSERPGVSPAPARE